MDFPSKKEQNWIIAHELIPFHSVDDGGFNSSVIQWCADGRRIFCIYQGVVKLIDLLTGSTCFSLDVDEQKDEDAIDAVCIFKLLEINNNDAESTKLFTVHKSSLIRIWKSSNDYVFKVFQTIKSQYNSTPIVALDASSEVMTVAGSDGRIRIWNYLSKLCLGTISRKMAVPSILILSGDRLVCGTVTGQISVWNMATISVNSSISPLCLDKHTSYVTSIIMCEDKHMLISAARDESIIIWRLEAQLATCLRIIPVYENIEVLKIIRTSHFTYEKYHVYPQDIQDPKSCIILGGGSGGNLRFWNVNPKETKEIVQGTKEKSLAISDVFISCELGLHAVLYGNDYIKMSYGTTVSCLNEEILDMVILEVEGSDCRLIVASNSPTIRIYRMPLKKEDFENFDNNVTLAMGHTDAVVSLAIGYSSFFASASKDNTVVLWKWHNETLKAQLITRCMGHAASVGGVCLSENFICSASKDGIIKLWPMIINTDKSSLNASRTIIAHQKDINSVDISPESSYIVTASQDKTAKVWTSSLELITTLQGHRRPLWCAKFSPNQRLIVTGSADATIKIWDMSSSFTCIKTFQGHNASVLRCHFITNAQNDSIIVSSVSSDGLLKMWDFSSGLCVGSYETNHTDNIWALVATYDGAALATGGADGRLALWRNVTAERITQQAEERRKLVESEQNLRNFVQNCDYNAALRYALKLGHTRQTRAIVEKLYGTDDFENDVLRSLTKSEKDVLLKLAFSWNTNGQHCCMAQKVINSLILDAEMEMESLNSTQLAGFISYSKKHRARLTKLNQRVAIVDHLLAQMTTN